MADKLELIKQAAMELNQHDFMELNKFLADQNKFGNLQKSIINYWGKSKKQKQKQQHQLNEASGGSDLGSNPTSSPPKPFQVSAWKAPSKLIFRGDKIPVGGKLYLDVEKITTVKSHSRFPHQQMAATVAVVNQDLKLVFWCFINWKKEEVCTYVPTITNLSEADLVGGITLDMVHFFLKKCFSNNNVVVGFDITNDLKSMDFTYDKKEDLAHFFKDKNNQSYKLKLCLLYCR